MIVVVYVGSVIAVFSLLALVGFLVDYEPGYLARLKARLRAQFTERTRTRFTAKLEAMGAHVRYPPPLWACWLGMTRIHMLKGFQEVFLEVISDLR
jgi:hypothetical protein